MNFTRKKMYLQLIIVVTNDFHQKVFQFGPEFANWDSEYTRGPMFVIVNVWEYLLYAAAVLILTIKCSITNIIRWAWVVLVPFAIGIFIEVKAEYPHLLSVEVGDSALIMINRNNFEKS